MEASDWIAIAALGASVIISIAGFWFNYKTNKENIRARRGEIVTEKSVEAFREMVEKLHKLRSAARNIIWSANSYQSVSVVIDAANDCYGIFIKYRLYFPRIIGENISRARDEMQGLIDLSTVGEREKQLENANAILLELIDRMQGYLGLEVEEVPQERSYPKN